MNELGAAAEVSKRTAYQHFTGKDELVAEYLRRFDPAVLSDVFDRTDLTPREGLLAALDIPTTTPRCPHIGAAVELHDPQHPASRYASDYRKAVAARRADTARGAGATDPEQLGEQLALLIDGAAARTWVLDADAFPTLSPSPPSSSTTLSPPWRATTADGKKGRVDLALRPGWGADRSESRGPGQAGVQGPVDHGVDRPARLSVGISGVDTHDSPALIPPVKGIPPIRRRRGPRRRRPRTLHADNGYDNSHLRRRLSSRGIRHRIARRGIESSTHLGRPRPTMEHTMSRLAGCRRLHRRHERKADRFLACTGTPGPHLPPQAGQPR